MKSMKSRWPVEWGMALGFAFMTVLAGAGTVALFVVGRIGMGFVQLLFTVTLGMLTGALYYGGKE